MGLYAFGQRGSEQRVRHLPRDCNGIASPNKQFGKCNVSHLFSMVNCNMHTIRWCCVPGGHGAQQPGPHTRKQTRLEKQADTLVALDVEYMHVTLHVREENITENLQLVSEICLVDSTGCVVFWSKIDSLGQLRETRPLCRRHPKIDIIYNGGTPLEDVQGMPTIVEARKIVQDIVKGRIVVGHNLDKDLKALEIDASVPNSMRRDTMKYSSLQNDKGHGRALAELAQVKLGRSIQQRNGRHCAKEDAVACVELYMKYCHFEQQYMNYDDLVEYYVSQMIP